MTENILEVRNLKKYFPVKPSWLSRKKQFVYAVENVSFSIKKGETLGLVGESGCGKSTLGRTILRLYEPTAGEIIFQNTDITRLSARELKKYRRQMQIIFQDPVSSLNPRMNVASILAEPFRIHRTHSSAEIKLKIPQLLEMVGLPSDAGRRYPHEFSGGQRQRIGIARAIALQPQLIIADEPVSALDVSIQSQILNLLSDLKKQLNLSYIFIAHDLAVIEHVSDKVAVMYLGKIVEYADAQDLYNKPQHPYTKALLSAIPVPELRKKTKRNIIKGDVPNPMAPPSGCAFHLRCPFVTDICRVTTPQLRNISEKNKNPQMVACHNV